MVSLSEKYNDSDKVIFYKKKVQVTKVGTNHMGHKFDCDLLDSKHSTRHLTKHVNYYTGRFFRLLRVS